ncbi:MAG: hypothetical protein ACRERU_19975, partial [Methylococcales bacterium]
MRDTLPPPGTSTDLQRHSEALGVLIGASVTRVSPRLAPVGADLTLSIEGFGLDRVTKFGLNPPDGLLVTDPFRVNAGGTRLCVGNRRDALRRRSAPLEIACADELSAEHTVWKRSHPYIR